MVKTRKAKATQEDSEEPSTIELLKLLAQQQKVLTAITQNMASLATSATAPPPPPPSGIIATNSPSQPPIIRGITTPKLPSPDNLTIPQFRDWKQRWEDYSKAQQLHLQPLDTQHGVLRSALDSEWTILLNSGRISVAPGSSISEILDVMAAYLRSRRNPLLGRQLFHRRDQMAGESVDRYYAALKTLDDASAHTITMTCPDCPEVAVSPDCAVCDSTFHLDHHLQEIRIRDRLICGLQDKEMQRRVLSKPFDSLTLQQVLTICSAVENSNATGATLASPNTNSADVAATSTYKKQKNGKHSRRKTNSNGTNAENGCRNCGYFKAHDKSECKATDVTCTFCNRKGHFRKQCITEMKEKAKASQQQRGGKGGNNASPKPTAPATQGNTVSSSAVQPLLTVHTTIANTPHLIKWLPDTGSVVDAISEAAFNQLSPAAKTAITPDIEEVVAANGSSLGPVGSAKATLRLNGKEYHTNLRIFKSVTTPLLSKRGCMVLGLIDSQWPYSQVSAAHNITSGPPQISTPPMPLDNSSTKQSLLVEFAPAFNDQVLRPMNGSPMKIELIPEAIPSKRYKAHTIPYHWRDMVREQLTSMENKGIIEPVPVGEAIDWCHPMVVVPKKGSPEPRITVDLTGLNKYVRRPAYPTRVPKEVVARILSGNRYFTTLDARHGYWQVPLDEASKKLTTFITPWGSYRFKRNVMGLISAGDGMEHNRRGDEALHGIDNVEKIVEDILIHDKDLDTHIIGVRDVLQRCQDHGITLNAKKFVFAQPSVEWCGFQLGPNGFTPAPHLVSALLKFPTPTSKTDVRSLCGLVQQFESFSHRITELMAPIRSLLSAKAEFIWQAVHERSFKKTIKELSSPHVLTHFQPRYPLRLETDAAQSKGLGYALWQKQPDQRWKLLQAGSRFVTVTESRYSASEIEMLDLVWAVNKCRLYLLGQPFELIVDHRPFIPIINSKTLDEVDNPRLQRFKEKLLSYRVTAIWRAGAKHTVVDVFSRFPVADPDQEDLDMSLDDDPTPLLIAALHDVDDGSRILEDPLLRSVKEASYNCSEYRRLLELITHGFPEKFKLDEDLHPFWRHRESLTVHEDLIFLGPRILIPKVLRSAVLRTLHKSHQGQQRTLNRARQAVFWPNITNDVKNIVSSCRECQSFLPSHPKEPLQQDPPPTFPFEVVGVDLFSFAGYEYLVMVDQYSGWLNIGKCGNSTTTSAVINLLHAWMTDLGIPVKLISDNGPQFSSLEFRTWAEKWGINHVTSSPHYPQSNGLAEAAVKSLKFLLAKTSPHGDITTTPFQEGLMELRNTLGADGLSPSQLLFGAPFRTKLPLHRSQFLEEWQSRIRTCDERSTKIKVKAQQQYNANAKLLSQLQPGDCVLIQSPISKRCTTPAQVLEACESGRSYLLRTESGRILRRNRRFLRHFHSSVDNPAPILDAPPPPPRRSTRQRRPPQRFACSLRGSRRSPLEGGHDGVLSTCPITLLLTCGTS